MKRRKKQLVLKIQTERIEGEIVGYLQGILLKPNPSNSVVIVGLTVAGWSSVVTTIALRILRHRQ